jgi:hypothetical protein
MPPPWTAALAFAAIGALASCAPAPGHQARIDPATGLPGCVTNEGLLPSRGPNAALETSNSGPVGFRDGSAACQRADAAARSLATH